MCFQDEILQAVQAREEVKTELSESKKEELKNTAEGIAQDAKSRLLANAKAGEYTVKNGRRIVTAKSRLPSWFWKHERVAAASYRYETTIWGKRKLVQCGDDKFKVHIPAHMELQYQYFLQELNSILSKDGIIQEKICLCFIGREYSLPHYDRFPCDGEVYIFFRMEI